RSNVMLEQNDNLNGGVFNSQGENGGNKDFRQNGADARNFLPYSGTQDVPPSQPGFTSQAPSGYFVNAQYGGYNSAWGNQYYQWQAQQNYRNELKKREKNEVFLRSLMVGLCIIAAFMMMSITSLIYSVITSSAGSFLSADNGVISSSISYIIIMSISFALVSFAFAAFSHIKISECVSFGKPEKGTVIPVFLFSLGMIAVANIAADIVSTVFYSFGLYPSAGTETYPTTAAGFFLWIVSSAVIPCLCEEIFCRGFIFGILRKYGDTLAMIVSAVIFAMIHRNFVQIPLAFVMGLTFAYSLIVTKSIWMPIGLHFFNNLVASLLGYAGQYMSNEKVAAVYYLYMLALFCMGVVGFILIKTSKGKIKKVSNDNYTGLLTVGERTARICMSPSLIVTMALCFLAAILNCVNGI
ncbi:MAG: lysostaphin resistance A-like protein, partial [Acutalibacteraceae bacterium]